MKQRIKPIKFLWIWQFTSELFLPEYMRDNVSVTERGYGNYDIQIIQNVARQGETFIDVGGKIERNHLTVFDPNILKRPVDNVFEWNMNSMDPSKTLEEQIEQPKELPDGSVEISNMSPGGTPEECRETIDQLEEEKYYKAYVTLNQVLPYETMYKFLKQYEDSAGLVCDTGGQIRCIIRTLDFLYIKAETI